MATVLVVDDDRDIRELVAMKLKLDGIEVLEAANGRIALEVLEQHHVDLVVLDLMMPVMDGIEACRAIREREEWKNLPIIMLTARAQSDDVELGFGIGATDYVAKPFSPRELLSRVRGTLARSAH